MPLLETEAIVLEGRDYRETSLLVTLLGRDTGRIGAVAKGARRPKANLAPLLQPFSILRVRLSRRPAGGLANLFGADLLARPPYARAEPLRLHREEAREAPEDTLARLAYAGLFAEVLTYSHENDPHAAELYDLAEDFLLGLGETDHPGSFAISGYLALLAALGYAPQLGTALPHAAPAPAPRALGQGVRTTSNDAEVAWASSPSSVAEHGQDARATEDANRAPQYHLDLLQGTLHPAHPAPRGEASAPTSYDFALNDEELDCLRRITRPGARRPRRTGDSPTEESAAGPVLVSRRAGRTLLRLTVRMFETHLERPLRSARFLETMVLAPPTRPPRPTSAK